MKKILIFNSIKLRIVAEACAYSITNEVLGKFIIGRSVGRNSSMFIKYEPSENVDSERNIITFKIGGNNSERIKVFLEDVQRKLEEERDKSSGHYTIYSGIIEAISPQSNAIYVPLGSISITNNFIIKCISNEWVKLETLFSKDNMCVYEKMNNM